MKKFFGLAFATASVIVAAAYLISCFTHFIPPTTWKPISFFALGFFPLLVTTVLVTILWFFIDKKAGFCFCIVLLAGYSNLSTSVAFGRPLKNQQPKNANTLRVISWNVKGFDNNARHAEDLGIRRKMINFLTRQNADVLLLQEFVEYHHPAIYSNIQTLSDSLGFKYHYTSKDVTMYMSYGPVVYGCAIFSKYPLTDTSKIVYKNLAMPEYIISGNINFHGQKVRVITTHLSSMFLFSSPQNRSDLPRKDSIFIKDAAAHTKLAYYDRLHVQQAKAVQQFIGSVTEPIIFSGDLNAVPTSYAYKIISHRLTDAFLQKGSGLGATFSTLSPTLRIDYILTSANIITKQYYSPKMLLSDHYPVVADLQVNQPSGSGNPHR